MGIANIVMKEKGFQIGGKLEGILKFYLKKQTKVRDITIKFEGYEEVGRESSLPSGDCYDIEWEKTTIVKHEKSLTGVLENIEEQNGLLILPKGNYELPFSLSIPEDWDILPTYNSKYVKVKYNISAKVEAPWRFHITSKKPVILTQKPIIREKNDPLQAAYQHKSILPQVLSPDIDVLLELDKKEYNSGDKAELTIKADNQSNKSIKGVILQLYAWEHIREGSSKIVYNEETSLNLEPNNEEHFSEKFNFELNPPVPTISGRNFRLDWYLNVELDIKYAQNIVVGTEITIY